MSQSESASESADLPQSSGTESAFSMVELAQRLRQIRIDKSLTLEDVCSKAGFSRAWLSKVENFRVTPSLPALSTLASVLNISMSELFEGLNNRPKLAVIPESERLLLRRDEESSELTYASLAHKRAARNMDPFLITVPPTDDRPRLTHAGEEFMFVVSGKVALEYGDARHLLGVGDCAYFDGDVPHRFVCESEESAEVLVVYYGKETNEDAVH